MRRQLGEGRWDKILIRKMTELSVADNYDDAKEEWIATGDVWWSGNGDMPSWVLQTNHALQCLCGHPIVYHFRIRNTQNGVEEVVGSDHINSYLIMRQIAEEKGLLIGEVTDEQVAEWIKVRVGSMKAEAWWAENGESFEMMFNKIKELDCWYNTHKKEYVHINSLNRYEQKRVIRKKGKGTFATPSYKMASIVWRWNHPDNPKNQLRVHGYPNDNLMKDLAYLYVMSESLIPSFNEWKKEREERKAYITESREKARIEQEERMERRRRKQAERERIWNLPENVEKRRLEQEERERLLDERRQRAEKERQERLEKERIRHKETMESPFNEEYENNCHFLGLPVLTDRVCETTSEYRDVASFKRKASLKRDNLAGYLRNLKNVVELPPTEKQKQLLLQYNVVAKTRLEAEQILEEEGENERFRYNARDFE